MIGNVPFTRASTLAGMLNDKGNLINWKAARVAEGFKKDPSLADLDLDLKDLAEKAAVVGGANDGADAGTAIHEVVSAILEGREIPDEASDITIADAQSVVACIENVGITPLASELFVQHKDEVAGTLDLLGQFDFDEHNSVVCDIKSSGQPAGTGARYSSLQWAIQILTYAQSLPWNEDGIPVAWEDLNLPAPRTDVGIVFHVQRGTAVCTPIKIYLDPSTVATALAVRTLRTKRLAVPAPVPSR